MTEVGFYHLTRTGALQALPRLLGRTLAAGQRALVLCGGREEVADVSAALWNSADPAWLPHGCAGRGTGRPEWHPIWLASAPEPAPNGARFLFLLGGSAAPPGFDRVFDLFDGNDPDAVTGARQRWTGARQAGHRLTYWQQGPGGWVKKG